MTKSATIEKIHSIKPHPNPEVTKIEIGMVKAWPVVVPKGQFKDGDLVIFIQIDSIVPKENPYFSFMERQHYRVWNAKFKKAPSQGLVCPLSILPVKSGFDNDGDEHEIDVSIWEEGDDVTEILGIIKYEKPLDLSICGDVRGGFTTHLIPITDEDNLLNNPTVLNEFMGEECYLTVKVDGSSMTVIHENSEVRVCSRKLEQKEGTGFWKIAEKYDLPNNLKKLGKNIAIQAEACGGKIQGNPLGLLEPMLYVFNIKELDTGKWYGWKEIKDACNTLNIPAVSLVYDPFIFDDTWTIEKLQKIANTIIYYIKPNREMKYGEGIVLRPTKPKYSSILGKLLSVKILNQEYK
jgi:RNA ligase (TIGR02306 family)